MTMPTATTADEEEAVWIDTCDGLHDEGAPAHYLCTRCFPDLFVADPVEQQDEAYEEDCCTNAPEME